MKKIREKRQSWAIKYIYTDINSKIYNGFFEYNDILKQCEGFTLALFRTRKIAREFKKKCYINKRIKYKVCKVDIEIKDAK